MWLLCPDPNTVPDWQKHVEYCHRESDIDLYVRRIAPHAMDGHIHIFRLEQTIKQVTAPVYAKYKVTKDGEVVPF